MSYREEVPGQTCWLRNVPPDELEEVAEVREVWGFCLDCCLHDLRMDKDEWMDAYSIIKWTPVIGYNGKHL